MHDTDFPEFGTPRTSPMSELAILREALRLLVEAEQLSIEDETLIADQVRNVLSTGTRQPAEWPAEEPPPGDSRFIPLRDESHAACPTCGLTAEVPDETPYTLDDEILQGHSAPCDYAERYTPSTTPAPEGFTVPERIAALGWHGAPAGVFETHVGRITKLVREAWGTRYCGEPIHRGEEDWYMQMHEGWVDNIINAYLAIQCGMQLARKPAHIPEGM